MQLKKVFHIRFFHLSKKLAEVTKLGLEVFDNNTEHFKLWLETPSFALGKRKPIDLLSDSYGKDLVISELVRIEEGIFV
jgi:putative toxin-antitoxin system antitoxin component (TIGR02293 family)